MSKYKMSAEEKAEIHLRDLLAERAENKKLRQELYNLKCWHGMLELQNEELRAENKKLRKLVARGSQMSLLSLIEDKS